MPAIAVKAVVPRWCPYIPVQPHAKQQLFLMLDCLEAFFGGAAGGGKSAALLMAALQYWDVPGYSALLLRNSYPDLTQPKGLIPQSKEWLMGHAAWNDSMHQWTFASGATLTFGHLDHEDDVYQYQGSAHQFIGFDEATTFTEWEYRFLFSRLRKDPKMPVPLRMRAASNPGGKGHDWVKRRLIDEGPAYGRVFIPSKLHDNPGLDPVAYERSLAELDPITRAQLLRGDWSVRAAGAMFKREWFQVVDDVPVGLTKLRYWDLAATEVSPGHDPDWTAGALVGLKDGVWYILDMSRLRASPLAVEQRIAQAASLDGRAVAVRMEQEPGASGKNTIHHYATSVLVGYAFKGLNSTGSKVERARPFASAAEAGNVKLLRGPWIGAFLDEVDSFPVSGHDDQVDAVAGALNEMAQVSRPNVRWLG